MKTLGQICRERRLELKISQRKVSKELGLADEAMINRFEHDKQGIAFHHLSKLSQVLGIDLVRLEQAWIEDQKTKQLAKGRATCVSI